MAVKAEYLSYSAPRVTVQTAWTVTAAGAQTCLNSLYYCSLLPVKVPKMAFHRHLFKSVLSEGLIKDNCH